MSRLLLFSAPSRPEAAKLIRSDATGHAVSRGHDTFWNAGDPCRVAIVTRAGASWRDDLERGADALMRADDDRAFALAGTMFFARVDAPETRGTTACLFPGYGVRRTTAVVDLVRLFPAIERWLDGTGDADTDIRRAPRTAGSTVPTTTLDAVLLADLALWTTLQQVGVRCDDMAGHSFGENAVLVASGIVSGHNSIASLLRDVTEMAGPLVAPVDGGLGMLALTSASRPLIDQFAASRPPRAFVSLDNCPNQMVIWGRSDDLAELERLARDRREVVFRLPELGQPVHTPLFPVPLADLRAIYDRLTLSAPRVRAWSAATVAPFPAAPAALREVLAQQWRMPVRFRELIERMYDEGTRTFVEVGPGDRLSAFVRNTLRGAPVTTITTHLDTRDTLTQLQIALAQLFVRGQHIDVGAIAHERASSEPSPEPATATAAAGRGSTPTTTADAAAARVEAVVADAVLAVLGDRAPLALDPDAGLFDLGVGSLGCIELAERLERSLGRTIPQTWPFDYPTVRRLAAALSGTTGAETSARERPRAVTGDDRADADIAIVGIGCRFPGGADSPASFFRSLCDGTDAVGPVPPDRWHPATLDRRGDANLRARESFGAFLSDIRTFDAGFFGISPREAVALDPQQRLLLEVAWEALEHAAISPASLVGSATGVFIGISNADYAARLSRRDRLDAGGYLATGNTNSTAAGRLSFFFGFRGPCVAIDTACSSSLVAVHQACQSLRRGESEVVLAGGVNLLLNPETTIFLSHGRALSPTGACRTFDAAADGYVRGEGCGVVVLKRLSDAVAAGDRVLAVIRGTAVNHDGRTSGLTVPYGPAQEEVVRRALADADCTADEVGYVEAHGTGTSLGDPIELNALGRVFGPRDDRPLRLGSVKTNIGHLEAAAGIAGLIKVTLQLFHRQLTPTLHFRAINPAAEAAPRTYAVVTRAAAWTDVALAGVSSFGISGTNAHVVMAPPPARALDGADADARAVFPLSAQSPSALRALAARLADRLEADDLDLAAVSETLMVGRQHFRHRKAFLASDRATTIARLREIAAGTALPAASAEAPGDASTESLAALINRYESGAPVEWPALRRGARGVADLPTYPFERDTYWIDGTQTTDTVGVEVASPASGLLGDRRSLPADHARHRFELFAEQSTLPVTGPAVVLALAVALDRVRGAEASGVSSNLRIEAEIQPGASGCLIQTVVTVSSEDGRETVAVYSSDDGHRWTPHASWNHEAAPLAETAAAPIPPGPLHDAVTIDGADFYRRIEQQHIDVDARRRVVQTASFGASSAQARLGGHVAAAGGDAGDMARALLLDGGLQILSAAIVGARSGVRVRVDRIARMVWRGPIPEVADMRVAWTTRAGGPIVASLEIDDAATGARAADLHGIEVAEQDVAAETRQGRRVKDRLRDATAEARLPIVVDYLRAVVSGVLQLPPDRPMDPAQSFALAGLDSLMALQVGSVIQRDFDVQLAATAILDSGTIDALSRAVLSAAPGASATSFAIVASQFEDGEL